MFKLHYFILHWDILEIKCVIECLYTDSSFFFFFFVTGPAPIDFKLGCMWLTK